MATILSQKKPLLRVISLRPTSLPHILYKNITLVSRPLSDIRTTASMNRRAIMNGAIIRRGQRSPQENYSTPYRKAYSSEDEPETP